MTADIWLTGRRGQALAVIVGVLGMLIVWFGIVQPVQAWFADRSVLLQQRHDMLIHMRDLAASLPSLRAESAERHEGRQPASTMLPGDSDSVAAATLQERVQKMAADAGANLTAVETLPTAVTGGHWHKVALRISLSASWPVLMTVVRSIEQSPTRILIDDVHFRSPIVLVRPTVLPIQASMVIYGFRTADAGSGT